jgi:N,N-dimethylformamidase beta subunit-like, C-terminal
VSHRSRRQHGRHPWQVLLMVLSIALSAAMVYVAHLALDQQHLTLDQQHPAHQTEKMYSCQQAWQAPNPVAVENTCPGTDAWQVNRSLGTVNAIEGFTSAVSVDVGQTVNLYVSTTAPHYTFTIYRMGWYGGHGGRLMYTSPQLTGSNQPDPIIDPVTHMVSCSNWQHPVTIHIPATWVSGYYIVKMLSSQGFIRYTPFVVRYDSSNAPIIYTASFLTYQAYNPWGGYSLYHGLDASGNAVIAERALVVSFDRPYYDNYGLMNFVSYEDGLLRWLERNGYNMTYSTDLDNELHGSLLWKHNLVIVAGHDEYWSSRMRQNMTIARDRGVSLAFFGANDIYWHIRLSSSALGLDREIVCYKHGYSDDGTRDTSDPLAATEPSAATVRWRDPPLNDPEQRLLGQMYHGIVQQTAPLVFAPGAAKFLDGAGLAPGSSLSGLVGYEYDSVVADGSEPANEIVLTSSPVHCDPASLCPPSGYTTANSTIYTAASGARVFDAGTFLWGRGLDIGFLADNAPFVNTGFQQFTRNILSYLLTGAVSSAAPG